MPRSYPPEPSRDCALCGRLAEYRAANSAGNPDWFNAPVPSFGTGEARLLIVGLAPGLKGANRTGRPFTGDFAGDLLYATLARYGFARGAYAAHAGDGLELVDCMVTNAVRCAPPRNKPTGDEIAACRPYLAARIAALPRLQALLALGRVAHDSILAAQELRKASFPFAHGNAHNLGNGLMLFDSYHCSRYNTNTGRLTPAMFETVFDSIQERLAAA